MQTIVCGIVIWSHLNLMRLRTKSVDNTGSIGISSLRKLIDLNGIKESCRKISQHPIPYNSTNWVAFAAAAAVTVEDLWL